MSNTKSINEQGENMERKKKDGSNVKHDTSPLKGNKHLPHQSKTIKVPVTFPTKKELEKTVEIKDRDYIGYPMNNMESRSKNAKEEPLKQGESRTQETTKRTTQMIETTLKSINIFLPTDKTIQEEATRVPKKNLIDKRKFTKNYQENEKISKEKKLKKKKKGNHRR